MGEAAQHEAIAGQQRQRLAFDVEAREAARARCDRGDADRRHTRAAIGGAGEHFDGAALFQRLRACEPVHGGIEDERRRERVGGRQQIAARHLGHLDALQIHRRARAGRSHLDGRTVTLQTAHARAAAARQQLDGVADRQRAAHQRARHDGAEAAHREGAIDAEPRRTAARRVRRGFGCQRRELRAQRFHASARPRRDAHDFGFGECAAREQVAHFLFGDRRSLVVSHVHLGERDDAAIEAEHLTDRQVLARLRHHALVGGDHQQHEVDAGGARHHRPHQSLVAGHVHHRKARATGQVERREAQLDGDAARLLFGEPVAVDAGERAHQRRLAVVDVTRGAEHESRAVTHHADASVGA